MKYSPFPRPPVSMLMSRHLAHQHPDTLTHDAVMYSTLRRGERGVAGSMMRHSWVKNSALRQELVVVRGFMMRLGRMV